MYQARWRFCDDEAKLSMFRKSEIILVFQRKSSYTIQWYTGVAEITFQDTTSDGKPGYAKVIAEHNNPPIIDPAIFDAVQEEMKKRSNIEVAPDGTKTRKHTRYSVKKL